MVYGISYLILPKMKNEFKRFGLEKVGTLTALLELLGALGLLVGFKFNIILLIASAGLAILMLLALIIRIKVKDSLFVSIPALMYLLINSYIFFYALNAF